MMIVIASLAVGLVAFIVYALERKSKGEAIVWESAGKLALFSGLVTSGVVFATTTDMSAVSENIMPVVGDVAQDMFVGTPSF
jgi:hypothetical protein